jgi:hypothetical protein
MLSLATWVMEKVCGCRCLACQFRRDQRRIQRKWKR